MWMRTHLVLLIFVFSSVDLFSQAPFIMTWQTDNPGISEDHQISIPGTGSEYLIEWEEVNNSANNGFLTGNDETIVSFPSPGTYQVSISGEFKRIRFNNEGDRLKLLAIDQWGGIQWESMAEAFMGCENMIYHAEDIPDLSQVDNMRWMFFDCRLFNGAIGDWDVSNVTNMHGLFTFAEIFNQPIENWEVSNVTRMSHMFQGTTFFDQPIDGWDVSAVIDMSAMFSSASSFNQPIGAWDVSNVTNMNSMFRASPFNQPIGAWDISNVTTMDFMFANAESFNQALGNWDISSLTKLVGVFQSATSFNQPIGGWDMSRIISTQKMFKDAESFNQPIGGWNMSSVTDPHKMFKRALNFNQPIGNWDVSAVTSMFAMFEGAISFNHPIGEWNVSKVSNMYGMFSGAVSFNQPIGAWDVTNVEGMWSMFKGAKSFDHAIGDWNVSNVVNMIAMFNDAESFDQPIGCWDISSVNRMDSIFSGAVSFNQDLGPWEFNENTSVRRMLNGSGMSCQNYDRTLRGWNQNPVIPNFRVLEAEGLKYWLSKEARDSLVNYKNWVIRGDEFVECNYEIGLPAAKIEVLGELPICMGDSVQLSADANVAVDEYLWYRDGVLILEEKQEIISVKEAGKYTVKYVIGKSCLRDISERSEAIEIQVVGGLEPKITNAQDTVLRSVITRCEGKAVFEAEIEVCGDLSEIEKRSLWRLDIHNTGQFDIISTQSHSDGSARKNLRIEEELPFGTHRVQWEIRDEHGNVVIEEQLITLVDMNPPTPVCMHGISTNLSPNTGTITIPAKVFDVNSWDDCTHMDDLHFTFSSDHTHTHHTWNCDDLDGESEVTFTVEIWVTNEYGHQNHCVTYIKVQDNRDVCPYSGMLGPLAHGTDSDVFKPSELMILEDSPQASAFLLHHNHPNPFINTTTIGFELPETGSVQLSIYNSYGGKIYHQSRVFSEGKNEWQIEAADLPNSGFYLYRLGFDREQLPGRMLKME